LARHLGLSETEFWRTTLGQLHALHRQRAQARERQELVAGVLASVVANFSMVAPKKPLKPSDFGLGPWRGSSRRKPAGETVDDVFASRNVWRTLCGKPPVKQTSKEKPDAE
jgi:hypothetical protein